jgi:hypothetical protein
MKSSFHLSRIPFALAGLVFACGGATGEAPLRSPSQDYRPPPPTTVDGKPVGVDGVPPGDRLEEGAKAGTAPGLAPGWELDERGLRHDPKKRVGGATDAGGEHEHPSPK